MVFFDTPKEEVSQDYELLPFGVYRLAVIDSEFKTTKSGTGKYMSVAFQVLDGRFKDRRIFDNFNLENPSEQAQKIGRGQFKRFLQAAGISEALQDVQDAHRKIANKTLWAEVDQQQGTDGKTRNTIKKYHQQPQTTAAPAAAVGRDHKLSELDQVPF